VATLTEQAILKVVDRSTPQIRKINAELKKLFATAKSLKSISVSFKINTSGIDKATAALNKLNAAAKKTQAAASGGITSPAATRQLASHVRYVNQAATATNNLNAAQRRLLRSMFAPPPQRPPRAAPPTPPPGGTPSPRPGGSGGRGGGRTPVQAGLAGFAGGFGMGLSRLGESFGAVSLAGFAAARALEAVAGEAYKKERGKLSEFAQTSPEQRAELKRLRDEKGYNPGPIKMTETQWRTITASFLGDVGNSGSKKTDADYVDPKSKEGALQRARRADELMRYYDTQVVPGIYARGGTTSPEETLEGLKKDAQAMGISTQEMFDTVKDANGNVIRDAKTGLPQETLSKDFMRVAGGVAMARAADKDISGTLIKTVMAGMKTMGYTGTSEQIAEVLINAGSKGQRAANEAYRAMKIGQGVIDNKKLNATLDKIGAFEPGSVQYEKGKPKVGTGIPVTFTDDEGKPITLEERGGEWWRKLYEKSVEPMVRKANADAAERQLPKGSSKAAIKKAREDAEKREPTTGERAAVLGRTLGSAPGAGVAGIFDEVFGGEQVKSAIAQALINANKESQAALNEEIKGNWAAQSDNLVTVVKNAFADTGDKIATAIGASESIKNLGTLIANNPGWATIGLTVGPIIAVGIVSAVTTALGAALAVGLGAMFRGLIPAVVRSVLGVGGAAAAAGAVARGTIAGGAAGAARVAGLLNPATGAVITGAMLLEYVLGTSPDKMRDDMIKAAANKQTGVLQGLIDGVQKQMAELSDMGDSSSFDQPGLDKLKERLKKLQDDLAVITALTTPPKVEDAPAEDPQKAIQTAVDKAMADLKKNQPATAVTPAMAAAAAPENVSALQKLIPELAKTADSITLSVKGLTESSTSYTTAATAITTAGTTLSTAVSGLGTTATTFSTVFTNGATAIGNAGTAAADALSGRAPGIGEQIGAAAAKAISAAAAQVSINVNHTGEQPNTGRSAPQ
jgi:hypothetical protein